MKSSYFFCLFQEIYRSAGVRIFEDMMTGASDDEEVDQGAENIDITLFPPNETAYVSDEDSADENQAIRRKSQSYWSRSYEH